jgi:hypothetical protein
VAGDKRTAARHFQTCEPAINAKIAKKAPVTSSHRTLENRASGLHMDFLSVRAWAATTRTSTFGFGEVVVAFLSVIPAGNLLVSATGDAEGVVLRGSGAAAASAALINVFAACRAPVPSARPKRTLSMPLVYPLRPTRHKRNLPPPACIQAPGNRVFSEGGRE